MRGSEFEIVLLEALNLAMMLRFSGTAFPGICLEHLGTKTAQSMTYSDGEYG
jgi:hypothetical protein